MKRFYKFLMPLALIAAMVLPATVTAQMSCPIKIVGADDYGDAWNDGYLTVVQGGVTLATFYASNTDNGGNGPAYDSIYVVVDDSLPVTFVWHDGDYDDEVSIWIYNGSGTLAYSVTMPSTGTIYTMTTVGCPSCGTPTSLTATVTGSDVDIAWTENTGSSWQIVYGTGTFNPDTVTVNSYYSSTTGYSFYGLDDGQYTAYVRTDCGSDSSLWASVHFNIGITIMNMATSGSDTIHSCNAIIYDDGGPTGNYSNSIGSSELVIYPGDSLHAISISGSSYTESTYDYLRIYDGVGTTGEILWTDYGVSTLQSFGPFVSDHPLTIYFHSDGSVTYSGFEINVSCIDLPSCLRPESFVTTDVDSASVSFSWVDSHASNWTIGYGPAGFTLGDTNTTWVDFTDTFGVVSGLDVNTAYDFYLMAVCGDTSWSRFLSVRTSCGSLHTLPYVQDFEGASTGSSSNANFVDCMSRLNNGSSYFGWPYVGGSTYNHTTGGNKGLYWYNSITTGTYGDYQIVALPSVDTNIYPVNTLMLTFWARPSSASYSPQFQVGVMTDPNDATTFQQVGSTIIVNSVTTWQEFSVILATYTGSGRYVAIRALRPASSWYAYVDDITLKVAPSCPPVTSHNAVATASAVRLTWDYDHNFGYAPDSYEVTYRYASDSSATPYTVSVTDPVAVINGLDADTVYTITIAPVCDGTAADSMAFNISTGSLPCLSWDTTGFGGPTDTVTLGAPGTSTTNVMPINQLYNYSYCQHLFLSTDIPVTGPTTFTGIGFQYAYSQPMTHATDVDIYMANTTRANMNGTDSTFVPYSQLQLVYSGPLNCNASGWNYFNFNQGMFSYDGTSNVVVAIVDNSGSSDGSNFTFYYQTLSGNAMSHRVYGSTPYDSTAMDAARAGQSFWRSNTKLLSGGAACTATASCYAPAVFVSQNNDGDIDVEWIPGYQETSWDLDYRADGDSVWTNVLTATTSTNYTFLLDSLQTNTHYTFRVSPNCTDTIVAGTASITTPCGLYSVPFSENFDTWSSTVADPLPSCWRKHTNYTSNYPYASTGQHHSGTKSMYMYSTASTYCYMALPQLDAPIDTLVVGFWLYSSSIAYRLDVGVMTDPDDVSTFTTVSSVTPRVASSWDYYEVQMASYTGTGRYIAIMSPTGITSYPYLDDLEVFFNSPCTRVDNVSLASVSQTTATIMWDTTAATSYEVQYGAAGFTVGSGTVISGIVDDTATITGLTANTQYDVYVRGICSPDTGAWSSVFSFRTECSEIDSLPYVETFEGYTSGGSTNSSFIPCWTRLNNGTSYFGYPYLSNSSTYNHTSGGTAGLYWYNSTTATTYGAYQVVILPPVDTTVLPLNTLQLSFWAKASSISYSPVFQVGVMNSVLDTAMEVLGTVNVGNSAEWQEYTVGLSSHAGPGQYVAIRALRPSSSWYAYVDDVTLEVLPACARVLDLGVGTVLLDSATIYWSDTSSNSAWYVEYDTVPFTPGTSHMTAISVTDTFCVLSGLDSGTTYYVYVYPDCNNDVYWRSTHFTTLASSPASLPFYCDFEGAGSNGWDLINGTQANYWIVGNATANGGSRSLYITDDGTSNNYSGSTSYVFASRTFNITDTGNYICSFDWKCNGESSFDFLRAALVPAGTNIEAGSYCGFNNTSGVPTGAIAIDGASRLNLQSDWQTQVSTFNISVPGTYKMVFLWHNDASVYYMPPAAIDNVALVRNTCPAVSDLHTTSITGTTATIDWTDNAGTGTWLVQCTQGSDVVVNTAVTTHPYTITGLYPLSSYNVRVSPICSSADTGMSVSTHFTTDMCDNPFVLENWDTTMTATTSIYSPIGYSFYNYGYVQTIIDAADLAGLASDITAISFKPASTTAGNYYNNIDVYMANVSESDLSTGFIHPDSTHQFVQVINGGNFCYTDTAWQNQAFDNAFTWDGTSNVLVAVNRRNGTYLSGGSFVAHTHSASKMRYLYNDGSAYDINTVTGGTASATVGAA